jgi:eukaryotic-like serine/threonine-protein kinase
VLFEMLAGRPCFGGATVSDTIAAVLDREPDWSALPKALPPAVGRLLRRCLEKDPKQRWRDIGDLRIELRDAFTVKDAESLPADRPKQSRKARWVFPLAAALALSAIAVVLVLSRNAREGAAAVTRTTVSLAANEQLIASQTTSVAVSNDGRRIAYMASSEGRTWLYVRNLDSFRANVLEGTDAAQYPFFSLDGQWVAFYAGGMLKRVAISGGAPIPICDVPVVGRGGTWESTERLCSLRGHQD